MNHSKSRLALWMCGLGLAVVTSTHAGLAAAETQGSGTVSLQPTATVTWQELERLDARLGAVQSLSGPRAVPFLQGPPPRSLSPRPGGTQAGDPQAPGGGVTPDAGGTPGPSLLGIPLVSTGFLGLNDNNSSIPPDTHGGIGPSHAMVMLNTQVRILTRAGVPISTVSLATFWSPAGPQAPFDPKLIYDPLSSRWLATCDADGQLATSKVFFAISASSDPTGAWTYFSLDADPADLTWADYPGMGVNSKWIVITQNMFTLANSFVGVKMWVIDKTLLPGALNAVVFNPGFDTSGGANGFTMQPCQTYGAAESKLYLVDNSGYNTGAGTPFLIRLSELTGTAAAPAWSVTAGSSFPSSGLFPVASNFNFTQVDAPQRGSASLVETNDPRVINAVHRNGRVWLTHSGGLPAAGAADRTAAFWYQLNPAAMPAPIVQSGVLDGGPGVHHTFPSVNANSANDAMVGFSRADASRFVEGAYANRLGTDAPNTMRSVKALKCGEASYFKDFGFGRNRWGDYSATVVDPVDDLSFWTLQEYAALPSGGFDRWGVWWGQMPLPVPPDPAIKSVYVSWGNLGPTVGSNTFELHPEIWCPGNPPQIQSHCSFNVTLGPNLNSCDVCNALAAAINSDTDCQTGGYSATCNGNVLCVANSNPAPCPGAFVCFDPIGLSAVNKAVDFGFLASDMPFNLRLMGFASGAPVAPGANAVTVLHTVRKAPLYRAVTYRADVTPVAGADARVVATDLRNALFAQGDSAVRVEGQILTFAPFNLVGAATPPDSMQSLDLIVRVNDSGLGAGAAPAPDMFAQLNLPVVGPWGLAAIGAGLGAIGAAYRRRFRGRRKLVE